MNRAERLALADHDDPALPVTAQCRLLKVARSTLYYQPVPVGSDELAVMRRIDELHLEYPFYGSRRMAVVLRDDGWAVNRKRARRLMRVMGLEAIYQKPNTSRPHPDHKVYSYLLRGLIIDRPNQVWCADITYIPMAKGFVYLAAVGAADAFRHIDPLRGPMDWFSRRVLAWRLSITMETDFCVDALREAMDRHGRPEIFNTDQGVRFTSAAFLDELSSQGVRISMDGKGRFLDNIFIERLWRSLKYEEVYIKAYGSVAEARQGIGDWLGFYNEKRPHQALDYWTPCAVHETAAREHVDNASASLRCAHALSTCSQATSTGKGSNNALTSIQQGLY
jgi:putative transposase